MNHTVVWITPIRLFIESLKSPLLTQGWSPIFAKTRYTVYLDKWLVPSTCERTWTYATCLVGIVLVLRLYQDTKLKQCYDISITLASWSCIRHRVWPAADCLQYHNGSDWSVVPDTDTASYTCKTGCLRECLQHTLVCSEQRRWEGDGITRTGIFRKIAKF